MKHVLIIIIGVVIICLLLINLFTPESVKRQNYANYVKNSPHIEYLDRTEKYSCPEVRTNPEYSRLKQIEIEKGLPAYKLSDQFQTCMEKLGKGSDWLQTRMCERGYEPDLTVLNKKLSPTIIKDKECERVIGEEEWIVLFGKKMYMLKFKAITDTSK